MDNIRGNKNTQLPHVVIDTWNSSNHRTSPPFSNRWEHQSSTTEEFDHCCIFWYIINNQYLIISCSRFWWEKGYGYFKWRLLSQEMRWEKRLPVQHANTLEKQLTWTIMTKLRAELKTSAFYLVNDEKKKNKSQMLYVTRKITWAGLFYLLNFNEILCKTNLNNVSQILTGWKHKRIYLRQID